MCNAKYIWKTSEKLQKKFYVAPFSVYLSGKENSSLHSKYNHVYICALIQNLDRSNVRFILKYILKEVNQEVKHKIRDGQFWDAILTGVGVGSKAASSTVG